MYKKVSKEIIMILVIVAIVTVPSSVLQVSYAQSDLANTVLAVHNRERAAVELRPSCGATSLPPGLRLGPSIS